jgi:CRISPR-associated protein Cas1
MDAATPELIPVRALNQVSYCPRLYYLEYVESVMPINEFVEDGLFQHRRVNAPELANRTRKEGDVLRTRSVSLSSERLGISGKLDLLEEQGDATRPVETKRSTAPKDQDGQPTFWENDAVQLCAQALLVEESQGLTIPSGFIYYAGSKARVEVPFDESLRAKTHEAIALIRDLAARDVPPEPLPPELRQRCFGCSLATICLPEETLYLIHQPESVVAPDAIAAPDPSQPVPSVVTLTRVIPQNDDKAVLYLNEQGSHVGKRSEHLVVSYRGESINKAPIASIRQVVVFQNLCDALGGQPKASRFTGPHQRK